MNPCIITLALYPLPRTAFCISAWCIVKPPFRCSRHKKRYRTFLKKKIGCKIRYSINSIKIHMHSAVCSTACQDNNNENINALHYLPFVREIPVTDEPSQSVVNEKSVCTPWRQRQSILPCIKHCHRDCNRRLSLRQLFITSVVLVAQGVFIMVTHCEARWQMCVSEMVLFREWFSVRSLPSH